MLTLYLVGRGAFHWASGSWTTVAQRLKLNDAGQSNGEQELFVNGQSVLHLTGLEIAADPATKIYGIMAQTFFVSEHCPLTGAWVSIADWVNRADRTNLGLLPVTRTSGSRTSRWPSLHDRLAVYHLLVTRLHSFLHTPACARLLVSGFALCINAAKTLAKHEHRCMRSRKRKTGLYPWQVCFRWAMVERKYCDSSQQ